MSEENLNRKPLTEETTWSQLNSLYENKGSKLNMRSLFEQDKDRFTKFR
jgi:hypothetical protein